jgi:hypothetical protein
MWLQNFVALFDYTYSAADAVSTISLTVSQYALPGASIDSDKPTQNDLNAFTYPTSAQNITILVNNKTMAATIDAELGFQGMNSFMLSLSAAVVQTYSTNCTTPGLGSVSCDVKPNFAINYFDLDKGTALEAANVTLDGYTTQGAFYNQTICIDSTSATVLCSTGNEAFFVADIIATNDWNYYSPATAGIIGIASGSPVWNLLSNDLTGGYYYAI